MTTVILAEKPDQARSYMTGLGIPHTDKTHKAVGKTFLDKRTVVVSAAGHLLELCEPDHYGEEYKDRDNIEALPIIPKRFDYQLPKNNSYLFNEIKAEVDTADRVIVATDKDNEGGAIAYNILRFCGALKHKKILRSYPSALNKASVIRQFKHLEPIDQTWRDATAATARGRSDWLIGMNLSRLYTTKLKRIGIVGNFAIGRAISTTLNLICQWYKNIENFVEEPIFELQGKTKIGSEIVDLKTQLRQVGKDNKKALIQDLRKHGLNNKKMIGQVQYLTNSIKETYPPILFTKGDLYKEMQRVAGWSRSKTKKVMQANYQQGYQTYPRTDSGLITKYQYSYLAKYFDEYLKIIGCTGKFKKFQIPDDKLRKYLTSEESAAAHLGIIPTEQLMDENSDVTDDQRTMYEVVVRKSLTILLRPYTYKSFKLGIAVKDVPFTAQNSAVVDRGWKKIMLPKKTKRKKKATVKKEKKFLDYSQYVSKGDNISVFLGVNVGKTVPPKPLKSIQIYDKGGLMEHAYKYVENKKYASILKKANGIGTSATRDQAMDSLTAKKYIMVDSKDVITVTANGWLINHLLEGSEVSDPSLTARWEEEYNRISKGEVNASNLINATAEMIYTEFSRVDKEWNTHKIVEYYQNKAKIINKQLSLGKCPACGEDVIFQKDTYNKGKYDSYKCTNPDCKFIIYKHYSNRSISDRDMSQLLEGKTTHELKGVLNKAGKPYNTKLHLVFDDKSERWRLRMVRKINPDNRYE